MIYHENKFVVCLKKLSSQLAALLFILLLMIIMILIDNQSFLGTLENV